MVTRMQEHRFPWCTPGTSPRPWPAPTEALRTPHFYVFDQQRQLVYTGGAVDNPRTTAQLTVNDLDRALEDLLAGKPVRTPLTNPIGCNVKWEGQDAHWMPPEACDLV